MQAILDSAWRVRGMPPVVRERIQRKLTYANPDYANVKKYSSHDIRFSKIPQLIEHFDYDVEDDMFVFPRGFEITPALASGFTKEIRNCKIIDRRVRSPVSSLKTVWEPNDYQRRAIHSFTNRLDNISGTACIVLPTSAGKTFAAVLMANVLKQRILVLTHRDVIRAEWFHTLENGLKLKHKDIGLIQKDKWSIGEHITVASKDTLFRRKEHWSDLHAQIGCLIVDEAHLCPATTFRIFATQCPALWRIAITATPKRRDGLHPIMFDIFGRPIHSEKQSTRETDTALPIADVVIIKTEFNYKSKTARYSDVMASVTTDYTRNRLIVKEVKKQYNKNHCCLVVSHRLDHVSLLVSMLTHNGVRCCALDGRTKDEDVKRIIKDTKSRKIRCIVATASKIAIGASIHSLDRLFITTSIKDPSTLEQLIGRIRRKHPGKADAKVIDFFDYRCSFLKHHFTSHRLPFYRSLNIPRLKNLFMG